MEGEKSTSPVTETPNPIPPIDTNPIVDSTIPAVNETEVEGDKTVVEGGGVWSIWEQWKHYSRWAYLFLVGLLLYNMHLM